MFEPKTILNVLQSAPFEFVIIGGIAATLHGSTRATFDFDICMELTPDNVMALSHLLAPHHPVHRISSDKRPFSLSPAQAAGWKNLYLSTDIGVIDILGEVKGLGGFHEVLNYSQWSEFGGARCRILSIEGLILAKEAISREKDREVILQLRQIQEKLKTEKQN
ncbi:nucleotidyltransferase [Kamptonema cortianum]|nr:nucleotidyltransferase [Kamptonema cortianum]MDL5050090.1 nucleotidyltransferase [Oscillatoria amoena NRMC-F 0135]